jgi:hypothetical protein
VQHKPYTPPEIAIINSSITFQLLAGSDRPGVDQENNVVTNGNPLEGDAGGAHSKSFGFNIDQGEFWDKWE